MYRNVPLFVEIGHWFPVVRFYDVFLDFFLFAWSAQRVEKSMENC